MATTLNLYEAKTQLSKLVERAAAGEEIVIAKAGKPMARLVALGRKPLRAGLLEGRGLDGRRSRRHVGGNHLRVRG
jgi:prevent-host-death family protein